MFFNIGPWGQAKSTAVPPNQKVNKAKELTYLFINSGKNACL
jgi:hypothetical protein